MPWKSAAKKSKYAKHYRLTHRQNVEAAAERWNSKNPTYYFDYRQRIREQAYLRVAAFWNDTEPRCRADTLPVDHPLRSLPCYGELQIDHVNGGGAQEVRKTGVRGSQFFYIIARGKRDVSDLRLLCKLHQLWNHSKG